MTESSSPTPRIPVSVLILTKNEEQNIDACLRSCAFSDDIVVLDSCSTDATRELAAAHPNVRVFERPFDTEYLHRNHGLHAIDYRHPWVYICDADERVTENLAAELHNRATPDAPESAFQLRYKNMFMGCWLRRATSYPVWIMRLVRPDRVSYEKRATNVHPEVNGTLRQLDQHFVHYSFNLGMRRWLEKHNYYSTGEAEELKRVRDTSFLAETRSAFRGEITQRRWLKNTSFRVPFRGRVRFVLDYLLRRGFADGLPGFVYCRLVCLYEDWVWLKAKNVTISDGAEGPRSLEDHLRGIIESAFNDDKPEASPSRFELIVASMFSPTLYFWSELLLHGRILRGFPGILEAYARSGDRLVGIVARYERAANWPLDYGIPAGETLYPDAGR